MSGADTHTDALPVMTDAKLKSAFGRVSDKYTHDSYSGDTSWAPIQKMMKDLKDILPTFGVVESFYDNKMPNTAKTWVCMGAFVTPAGVQRVVPAQIKAHGGGSIEDPLDRFDLTFVYTPMSPKNISDMKQKNYLEAIGIVTGDASNISVVNKYASSG